MDLLWLTDPHLNFLPSAEASRTFGQYLVREQTFDAVILSGDIAEAPNLRPLLSEFARGVAPRTVYFVLGNHDYYRSSIAAVRAQMRAGFDEPNLVWLDEAGALMLDDDTALVGHQGWFDARCGDPERSRVIMSDFELIAELREHYVNQLNWIYGGRQALIAELRRLGTQAAAEAEAPLRDALRLRRTVVFVTHYPPFEGACWHEGAISDKHWLPWFTCQAMGDMLLRLAKDHPERRLLVLCGHTHGEGLYDAAANLRVLTGKARYGAPEPAAVLKTPLAEWTGGLR